MLPIPLRRNTLESILGEATGSCSSTFLDSCWLRAAKLSHTFWIGGPDVPNKIWVFPKIGVSPNHAHINHPFGVPPSLWKPPYGFVIRRNPRSAGSERLRLLGVPNALLKDSRLGWTLGTQTKGADMLTNMAHMIVVRIYIYT